MSRLEARGPTATELRRRALELGLSPDHVVATEIAERTRPGTPAAGAAGEPAGAKTRGRAATTKGGRS